MTLMRDVSGLIPFTAARERAKMTRSHKQLDQWFSTLGFSSRDDLGSKEVAVITPNPEWIRREIAAYHPMLKDVSV